MSRLRNCLRSRASVSWPLAAKPCCRGARTPRGCVREEGLGVEDALAEMPYLTEQMLVTLGKANIRTLDDPPSPPTS